MIWEHSLYDLNPFKSVDFNLFNPFQSIPGDDEGQGSLACCSPWDGKESDMTKRLNNNKIYWYLFYGSAFKPYTKWLESVARVRFETSSKMNPGAKLRCEGFPGSWGLLKHGVGAERWEEGGPWGVPLVGQGGALHPSPPPPQGGCVGDLWGCLWLLERLRVRWARTRNVRYCAMSWVIPQR